MSITFPSELPAAVPMKQQPQSDANHAIATNDAPAQSNPELSSVLYGEPFVQVRISKREAFFEFALVDRECVPIRVVWKLAHVHIKQRSERAWLKALRLAVEGAEFALVNNYDAACDTSTSITVVPERNTITFRTTQDHIHRTSDTVLFRLPLGPFRAPLIAALTQVCSHKELFAGASDDTSE